MHTNTFCKYRKNYSHRLACILLNFGTEAENISVRSSISDQCYFYAKYDKNALTSACFFKLLRECPHSTIGVASIECSYNPYFL